ncbi:Uncharacterized BCR%2C YitT family COG1284 [uncultured Roseburia sp.]|uniref:DUF6198 family protein n=1 Tax=Brotonthovivens ammoniilytica TaxID=2981725 RepID=A0ABT2TH40_9FIRM|nr:DUF6198 family protein [Brotonthovivens ammoniilytica]MCU6761451.1 DUF6198 family protein [Brotonthovivens ammoniilytica]SCI28833.1 Uncharacterized BCR%2C YitT family COG1284 [uncultured Roseburia sp.]
MNSVVIHKNTIKRYLFLCLALIVMAFGVAMSIKANLGTSPISSFPFVLSLLTPLSVGKATILLHCTLIALQILILRRRYRPVQLIQLPVAFLFGYLTDFAVWALQGVSYTAYWQQWLLCIAGIFLVAAGVSLEVTADAVTLAGEGFVLAVCQVLPIKFGNMKVAFDVTLVAVSCLLSVLFTAKLQGVREGTVAAAVFVGLLARQFNKPLHTWFQKHLA